jgi:hypothetical protein
MKKTKIGSIFLISMLVLTGIGVSYAGFTDNVYVSGAIDTATVHLNYISNSHTYVWKVMYTGPTVTPPFDWSNTVVFEWDPANEWCYLRSYEATTAADVEAWFVSIGLVQDVTFWRVAWAEATAGGADNHVITVDFHNIFPCNDYVADFLYHYTGTIPAKLTAGDLITSNIVNGPHYTGEGYAGNNWLEDLWLWHQANPTSPYGIWYTAFKVNVFTNNEKEVYHTTPIGQITENYQVHFCDNIIIVIWMHLPQDNQFQGCSGEFSIDLGAIQWYDSCAPP